MRNTLRLLGVLLLIALFTSAAKATTSDCTQAAALTRAADLALDEHSFDQVDGRGWRRLAGLGCEEAVAELIEAYLEQHPAASATVHWHLAQSLALLGRTELAKNRAKRALRLPENMNSVNAHWNAYVLATVAFWDGNRAELKRLHAALLETPRGRLPSDPLRKAVERLVACVGIEYKALELCSH